MKCVAAREENEQSDLGSLRGESINWVHPSVGCMLLRPNSIEKKDLSPLLALSLF